MTIEIVGDNGAARLAEENETFPNRNWDQQDPFWAFTDNINSIRWNQQFPYQLLVINSENKNIAITYTLPIPPQSLTVSTPFAISTTATMGGIIEQHNGSPIRTISLSGTTGLLPMREGNGSIGPNGPISLSSQIFAGTIQATKQLATAAQNILTSNTLSDPEDFAGGGSQSTSTGYYQFHLLKRFIENYINLKKQGNGKVFRLAFAMWKDDDVYLVTPVDFNLSRSASSPWEYSYSLSFKAWRRYDLTGAIQDKIQKPASRDHSKLANVLNILQNSRKIIHQAVGGLQAVRTDIGTSLLNPLRETVLFIKDILGAVNSLADLPPQLINDCRPALTEAVSLPGFVQRIPEQIRTDYIEAIDALKTSASLSQTEIYNINQSVAIRNSIYNPKNDTTTKIFQNSERYLPLFDSIKSGELNLSGAVAKSIAQEKLRISQLTRKDFEDRRNSIMKVMTDYADAVGAGDATYSAYFGKSTTTATTRTPTDDDFDILFNLNEIVLQLNELASTGYTTQNTVSGIEYTAGLAARSGIAFTIPTSKFLVPFPYGSTLEMVSAQYLGTPDRWHEIAALNGLRAPYVDEVGFSLNLLTNGNGNQVSVSDVTNLHVGQIVYVASNTVRRTSRRVTAIRKIYESNYILTLDGSANMETYTTVAGAQLQSFLPDTVNSQQTIFIPSANQAANEDFKSKQIPGVDYFDDMVRIGGVDLLVDQTGDLVFTPDGDCKIAAGYTNLVQSVRLAIATPRGELFRHPTYGLGLPVGESTANVSAKDMLRSAKALLRDDPAFKGVHHAAIFKNGNTLQMSLTVEVAGVNQLIPITVSLAK